MSFGLEGGWSITMPLVWLLPMLRVSSVRSVESGGMVCNLSDLLLLISPSWHSTNLVCLLSSLTVLIAGGDVALTVCELPRSQCSTLADCWSLRLAISVGEESSGSAAREGWWGAVDGKRASCLGKRNRDKIWYSNHDPCSIENPLPLRLPSLQWSEIHRIHKQVHRSVHSQYFHTVRKFYLSCGQHTNTCTTIELLHIC